MCFQDSFDLTPKVLGKGQFAVVKECRARETGQIYAAKIIDTAPLNEQDKKNIDMEVWVTIS